MACPSKAIILVIIQQQITRRRTRTRTDGRRTMTQLTQKGRERDEWKSIYKRIYPITLSYERADWVSRIFFPIRMVSCGVVGAGGGWGAENPSCCCHIKSSYRTGLNYPLHLLHHQLDIISVSFSYSDSLSLSLSLFLLFFLFLLLSRFLPISTYVIKHFLGWTVASTSRYL